jgi:crotonobetainyl-CoA:carnitine CoA-transferase CaiB-like acyl-CoA transferase
MKNPSRPGFFIACSRRSTMAETLLSGLRVLDLAGEPAQMAGRILADLGAEVVKVEPPGGDPLRAAPPRRGSESLRFAAWNAGKTSVVLAPGDPRLAELLAGADLVLETPGWPSAPALDPASAPQAVWVRVTPFGASGPRARWRASDLGVMAASGNLGVTGDPDRAPVRCTEPSGYAHVGPEVAFAALSGIASGRPQVVDVSMQEVVVVANMSGPTQARRSGQVPRRGGASVGRTREIWRCADGWVSFGLRGGRARVPSLELLTRLLREEGLATPAWTERDWSSFDHATASDAELAALEGPLGDYFARHTMQELYDLACETNLMLASANSPREIYASAQAKAREVFAPLGDLAGLPHRIGLVRSAGGGIDAVAATRPAPALDAGPVPSWERRSRPRAERRGGAWEGLRVVEFGAGAAGPIASRYLAENGATVVKVESRSRPEFLRVMWASQSPHGLEGSPLFDALNPGKLSVALNLKSREGVEVARRLMLWADVVLENFAPKAMRGFGLDYDTIARDKPELVMVSTCLNGQTGPHRDYPGFGGQGSALSGFNWLTGWPDREPVGPFGTITDSLAPRFAAVAMAAGVTYCRRTGRGVYFDLSQVEVAQYTLAPWLLDYANNGHVGSRMGNRSERAAPHGVFPCAGQDRWVAIAAWSDAEWRRLAAVAGIALAGLDSLEERLVRVDEIEAALSAWTRTRSREDVAARLQDQGIEAVPVADFLDLLADPQLAARGHFVPLDHPVIGESHYERNGFRLSDAPGGYLRPTPTIGQHNVEVLESLLGLSPAERERLVRSGGVES